MASVKSINRKEKSNPTLLYRKLMLVIAVFSFLLYANSISNGYNIDDDLVTINHRLTSKGIKAIPEIFSTPYYKDAAGNQYEYRPVTLASFAIEHQLLGTNAHVSHLINVLLFITLSLILFLTLLKLFNNYNYVLPFAITLLFIAHPLHTEVVASIKNRDELLCLTGGILAFYYSLLFVENNKIRNYLLYVFFFAFAMLSKKSILPFVLLIPIAHVIFTRPVFLKLILISLPLSICAGLFWPLDNSSQKIGFALIPLVVPPIVFFVLYKRALAINFVSTVLYSVKKIPQALVDDTGTYSVIHSAKAQWILIPLTMLCSVAFCYYDLKILLVIYFLFLGLLFLFTVINKRNGIFYNHILFVGITSLFYSDTDFIILLFAAGLGLYFTGGKKMKDLIPLVVILIISAMLSIYGGEKKDVDFTLLILLPVLFYFFYERDKRIIVASLFIALVVLRLVSVFEIGLALCVYAGIAGVLFFLHAYPKLIKNNSSSFFVLAFVPVALIYFAANRDLVPSTQFAYETFYKAEEIKTNIEKVKIVPASGRKLNFVEMPLIYSDPISVRVGTSFTVLGKYLKLLVVPYHLGFYYGYAYIEPVAWTNYLSVISIIIHLLLVVAFFYFFKNHPVFSFGIFFYLLCISEFSNFAIPVAGVMGDRLAFVASAGFCIALGYGLLAASKTELKSATVKISFNNKWMFFSMAVLVLYSAKTFSRNFQWKDQVTLMRSDIKHLEKSVQANNLLAFNLVEQSFKLKTQPEKEKYLKEAIIHFKKAVEIYPKADFAWHDLGQTYLLLNNMNDALPAFLKAIEIDSTYLNALTKAANIYTKQNKFKEAAFYYEKVIANDRLNIPAYSSLSQAYFRQGNFEKAIEANLKAIKIAPDNYDPFANMGKIYFATGDKKNALVYFEKAYKINPNDKNLISAIAGIYKEFGENEKAEFYFSKLNQIDR